MMIDQANDEAYDNAYDKVLPQNLPHLLRCAPNHTPSEVYKFLLPPWRGKVGMGGMMGVADATNVITPTSILPLQGGGSLADTSPYLLRTRVLRQPSGTRPYTVGSVA